MTIRYFLRYVLCASALFAGFAVPQKAHAAQFVVSSSADSGTGSLRQAVLNANATASNDTIVFSTPDTIVLTSGQISVTNNGALTITGSADGHTLVSGGNSSRIFYLNDGANVTLNRLSLNNGFAPSGGAIYNSRATLTINESQCAFNQAESTSGSGLVNTGGAIHNAGTLTTNNSSFDGNTCYNGQGGAIFNTGTLRVVGSRFSNQQIGDGSGGAIENRDNGTLTVDTSTFTANSGNGATGGAISTTEANTTINRSTFNRNVVGGSSNNGKIGRGGALYNNGGSVTATLSTFAFNGAIGGRGGAIFSRAIDFGIAGNILKLDACTLFRNVAPSGIGGGIFNSNGDLIVSNSIVAGNTAQNGNAPNIFGLIGGDYNLVDDKSGAVLTTSHNIFGKDARLGALSSNGGLTETFALLSGSPAIDAGNSLFPIDQRGVPRPHDVAAIANALGGNGSDIGAFEFGENSQRGPNFVVNLTDDHTDGACGPLDCTLREAIAAANSSPDASTITFDEKVFATKQLLTLESGLPQITTTVNLLGPTRMGAGVTLSLPSAQPSDNILLVDGGNVNIANLSVRDTSSAGILIFDGTVIVDSCTFTNCSIGIANGGSNVGTANLTVNNSTFYQNSSWALFNASTGVNTSTLNFCTLSSNNTGVSIQGGTVNISNSIVVGNGENIEKMGGRLTTTRSITSGEAGLDSNGLQDNGGPTPTIALLAGSRAINEGNSFFDADQRGVLRDSASDLGSFEFNSAPTVVSVEPQDVSDKVGDKRTFTLTVRDVNGAGEIRDIYLLVNTRLSWNEGATLIYVPNVDSPASGHLYLRRGDAFLPPVAVGAGVSSRGILDNGAVRVVANEVDVNLAPDSRTLTLSITATIRDGLVGRNTLFVRLRDRQNALAVGADNGYVRSGSYTVTPQFSEGTNNAPILSRATPSATNTALNSLGVAPLAQTFTFSAKDDNGIGDIESVIFLAGKQRGWMGTATFMYQPRTRRLYLRSDNGGSWLGGGQIGQAGIIENSQVRLDLSKVKATIYPDGKSFGFTLPLQAKRALVGQNKIWLRAQDRAGATAPNSDAQGYVQSGAWNVVEDASPANSSGLSNGNS